MFLYHGTRNPRFLRNLGNLRKSAAEFIKEKLPLDYGLNCLY